MTKIDPRCRVKMLVVGYWKWPQYEEAFSRALSEHGVEIVRLGWSRYFDGVLGAVENRLPLPGVASLRLNRAIVNEIERARSDWVFFWRPTHVWPSTLQFLAKHGVRTVSYNNDDPFGPAVHGTLPWRHSWLWWQYLRCLPLFDKNFFYRKVNCEEAYARGALHASVLMPYFQPWQDHHIHLTESERDRFGADVVFVGHYEPDGREMAIKALIDAGIKTKVWGGKYWTREVLGDAYEKLAPIVPAEGDDYTKALCGAKICLAFLSKLNRDTYTRRCFEIPACGQLMLAERTDDLMNMFREGEEACFFSSLEEMVDKVRWLIANPEARERIAHAGRMRVWSDGHDVSSRAREFLAELTGC